MQFQKAKLVKFKSFRNLGKQIWENYTLLSQITIKWSLTKSTFLIRWNEVEKGGYMKSNCWLLTFQEFWATNLCFSIILNRYFNVSLILSFFFNLIWFYIIRNIAHKISSLVSKKYELNIVRSPGRPKNFTIRHTALVPGSSRRCYAHKMQAPKKYF